MKVTILCIGRLGAAAEARLALDWAARAGLSGRSHGLGPVEILEIEPRKTGKASEGDVLLEKLADAYVVACDERGQSQSSRQFADWLGRLRDDGVRRVVFVIGAPTDWMNGCWRFRAVDWRSASRLGRTRWSARCLPNKYTARPL